MSNSKDKKNHTALWSITIFGITIVISSLISLCSESVMSRSTVIAAFFILLVIVFLGIIFDIIGVAVTSAQERPFHAMASRKVPGATEAIRLLKNAEKVSSVCNDVVGDICGVVSGSASAAIAIRIASSVSADSSRLPTLLMSSLVAGLTVGGKSIGKSLAIHYCTEIVSMVGKAIYFLHCTGNSKHKR